RAVARAPVGGSGELKMNAPATRLLTLALALALPTSVGASPQALGTGASRGGSPAVALPGAPVPEANAAAASPEVLVLKSADRSAYGPVEAGFRTEVRARVSSLVLPSSEEGRARLGDRIVRSRHALVLALGPDAAVWARGLGGPPVIFAMVPYYEKYRL